METPQPKQASLENVVIDRILDSSAEKKYLNLLCHYPESPDQQAVVILQKTKFETDLATTQGFLKTVSSSETTHQVHPVDQNDIYNKFLVLFSEESLNRIDIQLIYPATEKTINKYSQSSRAMVLETPGLFQTQVRPYIEQLGSKYHQWIYNILDKGEEEEKTIWKDKHGELGFTLVYNYTSASGRFFAVLTSR
jgi:m7GpppX diphosphatase